MILNAQNFKIQKNLGENPRHFGAENETRTRDPNLGKVVLYQLSYFRIFYLISKAFQLVFLRLLNPQKIAFAKAFCCIAFRCDCVSFPIASAKLRHFAEPTKSFMFFFSFSFKKALKMGLHIIIFTIITDVFSRFQLTLAAPTHPYLKAFFSNRPILKPHFSSHAYRSLTMKNWLEAWKMLWQDMRQACTNGQTDK